MTTSANALAASVTTRVLSITPETQHVVSIVLGDPHGRRLPRWSAGAHIDILLPGIGVSQYSLCGPLEAPTWKIAVLLRADKDGVSQYLHKGLRVGDAVMIGGPRNNFELVSAGSYFFLAGGIGITPFMPMIETAQNNGISWQMAYGGRSLSTMAFVQSLQGQGPRVRFFPKDSAGRMPVREILEQASLNTLVYCCGPESLIEEVQATLAVLERGRAKVERFGTLARQDRINIRSSFKIRLARSKMELTVPASRSIAEVLDSNGIFVPTSCLQGICGACETRVLEGRVDHQDAFLAQQDRERNDRIMVCVSRAGGDVLVLDL